MNFATQHPYAIRFEWGIQGVRNVGNSGGVTIIVDVLSFSTCVDIACSRDAQILPYQYKNETAEVFARANSALLAVGRSSKGLSLSPQSLLTIEPNTRLVLPSPNGSTLTLESKTPVVLSACLRNASAVAAYASRQRGPITVIAAGEQWENGALRPATEDLIGAGAVIHFLTGNKSPEAVAGLAFIGSKANLSSILGGCASAIELIERGFADDVQLAEDFNISSCVPRLIDGAYIHIT